LIVDVSPPKAFVIGHPIGHSRSPMIHGHWLETLGIAGDYERVDVRPDELGSFVRGFRERGFVGGNVTLPHKEAVFELVDEVTEVARRLGAVNTLSVGPDGRVLGDNTDSAGFVGGLAGAVGPDWSKDVRTALVLGAGGAARAVVAGLLDGGVARIIVANRTLERSASLHAFAPGRVETIPIGDVEGRLGATDLLVNTTSLGMQGQPGLAINLDGLPERGIVADIVYVPLETPLLAAARRRGLRTADGLGMLLHQAVPGFRTWFGMTPQVTPELRALIEADVKRG
jgi:shikimate dehydrogenase